jgi:hypothetical protein
VASNWRDLCGQIIPRRLWVAEVDGAENTFGGPNCEHLYRTTGYRRCWVNGGYGFPRSGPEATPNTGIARRRVERREAGEDGPGVP